MSDSVFTGSIFGIDFSFDRVAFTIPIGDGFKVYWYGILIAIGFLLALIYVIRNAKRFELNIDRVIDVILVGTPVAVLCARAYYLLFDDVSGNLSEFFEFKKGGLAILGGVIGGFISAIIMSRIRKVNILSMLDIASIGFLIGQAIGRWGNFFNQEAYGFVTGSSFFGMTSDKIVREMGTTELVHPCFLYESIWCAIGFFLLHTLSKHRKFKGEIVLAYGVWYGFGRFIIEGFRTDSLTLGNFRISQLISLVAFLGCAAALIFFFIKEKKRKGTLEDYAPMFEDELSDMENADDLDSDTLSEGETNFDTDNMLSEESGDGEAGGLPDEVPVEQDVNMGDLPVPPSEDPKMLDDLSDTQSDPEA